jgi:hypothetical protein
MNAPTNMRFTHEDVADMVSVLHNLIDGTNQIYNIYNNEPAPDSLAHHEQNSFADPELARDVHYRGIQSMESAADHLMVFADSMIQPAKTVAPWTCVRGLLESCAIAAWFLDPEIDVRTRIARCFAFRYAGFVQQIKYFQIDNRRTEIDQAKQRMIDVEQDALSLGYPRVLNRQNNPDGIAMRLPSITDLIGITLDRESDYRLLSAIAHGHHWAIQQVAFRQIEVTDDKGQVSSALEKHVQPNFVIYAGHIAVTSFAKVMWYLWRLYGWNLKEVGDLLDETYEKLHYNPQLRFWH